MADDAQGMSNEGDEVMIRVRGRGRMPAHAVYEQRYSQFH